VDILNGNQVNLAMSCICSVKTFDYLMDNDPLSCDAIGVIPLPENPVDVVPCFSVDDLIAKWMLNDMQLTTFRIIVNQASSTKRQTTMNVHQRSGWYRQEPGH